VCHIKRGTKLLRHHKRIRGIALYALYKFTTNLVLRPTNLLTRPQNTSAIWNLNKLLLSQLIANRMRSQTRDSFVIIDTVVKCCLKLCLCLSFVIVALPLWRPLCRFGYSYWPTTSCARPGWAVVFNLWHPGTLTLGAERQSARTSKITNDGLTRCDTFYSCTIWQQWASKGCGTAGAEPACLAVTMAIKI